MKKPTTQNSNCIYFNLTHLPTISIILLLIITSCMHEETEEVDGSQALMRSGYGIGVSTIIVDDLEKVKKYFSDTLGFNMALQGESKKGAFDGTLSYETYFADMSSLEFISIDDTASSSEQFVSEFLETNEGIGFYSLSSSSVDSTSAWLTSQEFRMDSVRKQSMPMNSPEASGWDEAGSQAFFLDFDSLAPPSYLPRFLEFSSFPYDRLHEWSSFYNMQRGFVKHPNGVLGTSAILIVVEDLDSARSKFNAMGLTEIDSISTENSLFFNVKRHQQIHIKSPQGPDDPLSEILNSRGSGVYGVQFEVIDLPSTYDTLSTNLPEESLVFDSLENRLTIMPKHAFGVQLEFVQEPQDQADLAQKLTLNFGSKLDSTASEHAQALYLKYCALCHGENREGYAADFAPSLRSHSLLGTSRGTNFLRYTVQFGRSGTAMAGYYSEQGGPLNYIEIELLLKWLDESSGLEAPIQLSREPVIGDVESGAQIYVEKCAVCHGENGEGITAPAIGGSMFLATATDAFLRHAISEGRDSTPMPSFKDSLSSTQIDDVTAFLRSRASGWNAPPADSIHFPTPEEYILNPDSNNAQFDLRAGIYLSAEQLHQAMQDSSRLVILDARSKVAWRQTHIPGSIPVPYYEEPEDFVQDLPKTVPGL